MKKIILGTAAVFSMLLLIFNGSLYYRKHQSFLVPLHKDAGLIIRVNVDGLLKTLAIDFLTDPGDYSQPDKKKEGDQKLETGLELTANVFLYNLKNQPNTLLGYLKISDVEAFRKFLKYHSGLDTFEIIQNGVNSVSIDKFRIRVLFDEQAAVFAFSAGKPSSGVFAAMQDLIHHQNLLPASDHRLSRLKDMDCHISFSEKNYEGSINFSDGEIHLLSTISTKALNIPDKASHKAFNKESSILGWLNADLRPLFRYNNIKIKDRFQIHLDSIAEYAGYHLELEMLKTVTQKDTVVTYAYDDNFEKVEERNVEERNVPEVYLTFKNTPSLLPYLQRQKIIDEKQKVNKEIFPLFDLYASKKDGHLELSSKESNPGIIKVLESKQFLYLAIDFNKIRGQKIFSSFAKITEGFDSLIVSGKKADLRTGEIKASIYLKNKKNNALQELIPF